MLEEVASVSVSPVEIVAPLSAAQERLWFNATLHPHAATYNAPMAFRLRGSLDAQALSDAVARLPLTHAMLRTRFTSDGVDPVQVVGTVTPFVLGIDDVSDLPESDRESACDEILERVVQRAFVLSEAPLARAQLVKLAPQEHVVMIVLHNLVTDLRSMNMLLRDLCANYNAILAGGEARLSPDPGAFAAFMAREHRALDGRAEHGIPFWREFLADAPAASEFPADRPRPSNPSAEGAIHDSVIAAPLIAQLRALAERRGVTLFRVIMTAYAILLGRFCGQSEVVFGVPAGNRNDPEVRDIAGVFVNMVPARANVDPSHDFVRVLADVERNAEAVFAHQTTPFGRIVEAVNAARRHGRHPIFQSILNYRTFDFEAGGWHDLDATYYRRPSTGNTPGDVVVNLEKDPRGSIRVRIEYSTALYDAASIERLANAFTTLLNGIVADPTCAVGRLPLLGSAERCELLETWNATTRVYPDRANIVDLIEAQVVRTPQAIALVDDGTELSFEELDAQANRLAQYLQRLGVAPDARVAICVDRGSDMAIAVLAVLKAGGAYVPLDPSYPLERLAFMLEDSEPVAVITHGAVADSVRELLNGHRVIDLDAGADAWRADPPIAPDRAVLQPDHLAYVIYTSGSTGRPKGVMVHHRGVVNLIAAARELYALHSGDVVLFKAAFSFDAATWELFCPLVAGAKLVLARVGMHKDPAYLAGEIRRSGVTVVKFVPSMLRLFLEHGGLEDACRSLRLLICGGEALPVALVRRAKERLPQVEVHNVYGPTETTVNATSTVCDPNRSGEIVPIGRPLPNTRAYILDGNREPVPVGVAGELYLGGAGVSRGYLRRPELTEERFFASPFVEGDRLYRTGDLVRYAADGTIEFLGRADFQVKIRGFRVELGEIEAQLVSHGGVRESVVLAREDVPGEQRLVAYYTPVPRTDVTAEALRAYLEAVLPEYMVPAAYVRLDELPLSPSGKLDRNALPSPDGSSYTARTYEAPEGELEERVASIWCEILRIERVGRQDHFFELGGHSLSAVRVVARLRHVLQVEVGLTDLFAFPVLSAFAERVGAATADALSAIVPVARDARLPLSFAQQRLWFLAQFDGVSAAYHIPFGVRVHGDLDRKALSRALDRLVARHETLRTSFEVIENEPVQRIGTAESGFALREDDLREDPRAEATLAEIVAREIDAPFDLASGPLVRGRLVALGAAEHVLFVVMHHIVSDGWSKAIFVRELRELYAAFRAGHADPLPTPAIQYADFAVWQRTYLDGPLPSAHVGYWHEALAGAPVLLELPTDRPRPLQQVFDGDRVPFVIDADLTERLRTLSARRGTTLFMTLLAAWGVLLSRLCGGDDVVIGTPVANRTRSELDGLIGFFVNTLALRVRLPEGATVAELLELVKASTLQAQERQDVPFERVVEAVAPPRSLAHTPLFQVMFAWQNNESVTLSLPEARVESLVIPYHVAKFDLTLNLAEYGDEIVGGLDYAAALFDRATIERHLGYLRTILAAMVADDLQSVAAIALLDAQERTRLVDAWNATEAPFERDRCVHELFEERVRVAPEALAVEHEEERLTYAQLNARANRLARRLRELGVGPDTRVALCFERSVEMIVGMMAVLKAGGAYVPLDPSYPIERLAYMLEDSAPLAVLTHGSISDGIRALFDDRAIDLDRGGPWETMLESDLDRGTLNPTHLAYVIYTSGSTGQPKGVMIEHRGVLNLAAIQRDRCLVRAESRVLQFSSLSFDAFVFEVVMAFSHGASLHIPAAGIVLAGEALVEMIDRSEITHTLLPPVVLTALPPEATLSSIQTLVVGGDALTSAVVERWAPGRRLINAYGPTESTVCATLFDCIPGDASVPPIGKPIANARVYVLDASGEPVPTGVVGELSIGGVGLARGYLHRPELTRERFAESPFVSGDRLYKTGDLARYRADGNIEFLGRADFQVKIRGFRVELGEIEARLREHEAVADAAVLAREDVPGERRLVAYYTTSGGEIANPSIDALRSHLALTLPNYMVPAAYVALAEFPLTPNGKLDRKALPRPDGSAYAVRRYEAPFGELEERLARMWCELLKVERVGRRDTFFELGGHSLLAVRLVMRVREAFGVEAAVADLFASPALADFALTVGVAHASAPRSIDTVERTEMLPLSLAQERLWFLAQLEEASAAYHVPIALRLRGDLDRVALGRAFDALLMRHEALRTTFDVSDGEGVQRIASADLRFALREYDLRGRSDANAELERLLAAEANERFDLRVGPLVRGAIVALGSHDHALLITMHHLVSDGWSMGVFVRELTAFYASHRDGTDPALAPLRIHYADYAVWQRRQLSGTAREASSSYWRQTFAGAPALLELPADRVRPSEQSYAGARVPLELDAELTAALKALSARHGTTLFMTLLAAWGTLLARLSRQEDVVVGVPVANRTDSEVEGLIGFFVNTLALRLDVSGQPNVGELLQRVKARAVAAQAHQHLPFEHVVDAVQPVRSLAHTPLFQVMFAWQNNEVGAFALPGLDVEMLPVPYRVAKFDLTLHLAETGNRITGGLDYATALFDESTAVRYGEYLRNVLVAMVRDERQAVDRLPMLAPAERERIVVAWNAPGGAYPADRCIHEMVEAHAAATPDAIALVCYDERVTYAELNARANRLARHLRGLGVAPDTRVAVCVERSIEMIVGLLAVLKAGGGYVPLDPAYPLERLAYMLEDSAPVVVLTHAAVQDAVRDLLGDRATLDLKADAPQWAHQSSADLGLDGLAPEHLAYIIYTSGSTGQPKGVMVEHRNVARLFSATQAWFHFGAQDVWTLFHSFAFDFSVWEIWGALAYGGRLVVVPQLTTRSPEAFYELVCGEQVTILNQTPSAFRAFVAAQAASGETHRLRHVIFGGEALETATLAPWYERAGNVATQLVNMYGITETTVHVTYRPLDRSDVAWRTGSPIGIRIPDLNVYVLDAHREPVPVGVAGELYVGGAGVARGYLNRPELTAERFIESPFVPGDRLYKTGDLARYRADGTIEFLGRTDFQVKIRGFRIELGEIEAQLATHDAISDAVVIAREDEPGEKRLVAYYTLADFVTDVRVEALRAHLSVVLPEYMVPAAYVQLDVLPLTANGKLDRRALPVPDWSAYVAREYEKPSGDVECTLAAIWCDVLGVERVGREDNFFELGGHSLMVVRMLERMRTAGLHADVRMLFTSPTLASLAACIGGESALVEVPASGIPDGCTAILPEMLPLVDLSADEIALVVGTVPGGAANVQDIYPLTALQEGILFHHLLVREGDPYIDYFMWAFDSRDRVERFLDALRAIVARHDVLRTSIVWEGLRDPVQVVWRGAALVVEEIELDSVDGDVAEQLAVRFDPRRYRLDVRQAPWLRAYIAYDAKSRRWVLYLLSHHLWMDHHTLEVLHEELEAHLLGRASELPVPLPYRNFVAQARFGISEREHEAFFADMLADVDEPTMAFGLGDVQGGGEHLEEVRTLLDSTVSTRLRAQARALGVSAASLFHVAWAQVLARVTGREDVVFGTVLFGRMQGGEGADRGLGLFINTLPLRLRAAEIGVQQSVLDAHALLAQLMRHEHASLVLAQRCSAVPAPAPLFNSLFNYRHILQASRQRSSAWDGITSLGSGDRTNYPIVFSVNDLGGDFRLVAQARQPVDPHRLCALMDTAVRGLVDALEYAPTTPLRNLNVLPAVERERVLVEWNALVDHPVERCIHELVEAHAARTPDAPAVVHEGVQLTYAELNLRANRLAHYLRDLGVEPDARVALCLERGSEMIVALLAVLKAGGAYVPLDPSYPIDRLSFMLEDSAPVVVLTQSSVSAAVRELFDDRSTLDLQADSGLWEDGPVDDLGRGALRPEHVAYVIYTSGSTGRPKGVMVEHRNVARLFSATQAWFHFSARDVWTFFHSFAFDFSVWEIWGALVHGGRLVVVPQVTTRSPESFYELVCREGVTILNQTPSAFRQFIAAQAGSDRAHQLRHVVFGGEALECAMLAPWYERARNARTQLVNMYGITETTVHVTYCPLDVADVAWHTGSPIGVRIPDLTLYILDARREPVPIGVAGEIYVGGAGVARGYLNRLELTEERFIASPFVSGDRLYKTGDLARYLPDGQIEFLGRTDFQVKIRGFRIELGEIEARLAQHEDITDAVVLAREDEPGERRLVAYYTLAKHALPPAVAALRVHLSAVLPDYMVPAAYVVLDALPLTANGKLDRRALPAPDGSAFASRAYEPPMGEVEESLANIWCEVLAIERVGRHDNFFELGGHSLLVVRVIERMRRAELHADVAALFTSPTLAGLAAAVGAESLLTIVPPNGIPDECAAITPEMLSLVNLSVDEIERVTAEVPGGAANVADIYPLAPLQEGILFHHVLASEGDPYLLRTVLRFDGRSRLDGFLTALQAGVDRHDILRTSVHWEGLTEPVQVVWRRAQLDVEEQLFDRFE